MKQRETEINNAVLKIMRQNVRLHTEVSKQMDLLISGKAHLSIDALL